MAASSNNPFTFLIVHKKTTPGAKQIMYNEVITNLRAAYNEQSANDRNQRSITDFILRR
jgi:hypothetical protein